MAKPVVTITDFVTGRNIPNMGAEENRQQTEILLVNTKGYAKEEIQVDVPISFRVKGQVYQSCLDLVVTVSGRPLMVIKCAAGSLGSREREVLAAARLSASPPVPLAAVCDGRQAIVLDVATGRRLGTGLDAIPSRLKALEILAAAKDATALSDARIEKERLIFRSYDSMNVNVAHRTRD